MGLLNTIYGIWEDLDTSYEDSDFEDKVAYLKELLIDGDKDAIWSLLAKISQEVVTEEDGEKYNYLKEIMLLTLSKYHLIPTSLPSLSAYVLAIKEEGSPKLTLNQLDPFKAPIVQSSPEECFIELITETSVFSPPLYTKSYVFCPFGADPLNIGYMPPSRLLYSAYSYLQPGVLCVAENVKAKFPRGLASLFKVVKMRGIS
jgi:hypothetical protein